jgi:hypothetical protein
MINEPRCLRLMRSCTAHEETHHTTAPKRSPDLVHYVHIEIAVLFVAGGPFQVVS